MADSSSGYSKGNRCRRYAGRRDCWRGDAGRASVVAAVFAVVVAVFVVVGPAPAHAQDSTAYRLPTLEQIHTPGDLSESQFFAGAWAAEGPNVVYAALDPDTDATSLVRYNLETDVEKIVIDGNDLVLPDTGEPLKIEGFSFSGDGRQILIFTDTERVWRENTKGYYYIYDVASTRLRALSRRSSGYQQFAKFSPDNRRVGFVRNRNLFVVDLFSGRERQLTYDGSEGRIINGTFDWVYEEEFGLRDGWSWSPDGSRIAFYKLDESDTREYQLIDLRGQYPEIKGYRYPKAGESNSAVRVGIIGVNTGTIRYVQSGTWHDDSTDAEYVPRIGWTTVGGASKLWLLRLNRDQNSIDVLLADPDSTNVETLLSESEETWIDVGPDKIAFLKDGRHFVWSSESSGFNHLYLYGLDGSLVTPITSGPWEVTEFHGVDEGTGHAYFSGTVDNAIERHLYRIEIPGASENLVGPSPERVSAGSGTHRVSMSPDLRFYIDSHSSASTPTVVSLYDVTGKRLKTLEDNAALVERLGTFNLPQMEFTTIPGADGDLLNAYLIKPTRFDPAREYPVLMYVYGGPGSQTVTDSWGGSRYLWHAYLAEHLDMVVASVDGRGTGARGKEFGSQTYRRLGLLEAADQVAAAEALGDLAFVDASRVGIWGWSYGGYTTLMSMLTGDGPSTFKLGIAVAPVSDWRLYDSIYTERYMSTPDENPEGYEAAAPLTYADRLDERQRLLLVHGDLDDNVHYQQSIQMADRLQSADKQFEMMVYPGRNHGIFGERTRLHLFTMMTRYLREHL